MQIYKTRYIPVGDYFIPDWTLPEEPRPIGTWGRMRRDYLKEYHPVLYSNMVLRGTLWTCLADLNEQAQQRLETIIVQMKTAGRHREAESPRSAGLGTANEQYPRQSEGNRAP